MHRTASSRDRRAAGLWSSLSSSRSIPCLPCKKLLLWITRGKAGSPQRKLYTAQPTPVTLSLSQSVRQRLGNIIHMQVHKHIDGCEGPLQQALIKSCSWALLLLSPCDWCLASLAVTNTDWSQTLNDFGPNLFKDSSLLCPQQTCCQTAGKYVCSECYSCTWRVWQQVK